MNCCRITGCCTALTNCTEPGPTIVEGEVAQRLVVGTDNHRRVVEGAFLAKVSVTVTPVASDGPLF